MDYGLHTETVLDLLWWIESGELSLIAVRLPNAFYEPRLGEIGFN
jgi:hypothetical protein